VALVVALVVASVVAFVVALDVAFVVALDVAFEAWLWHLSWHSRWHPNIGILISVVQISSTLEPDHYTFAHSPHDALAPPRLS
jgi:hypothetical protein